MQSPAKIFQNFLKTQKTRLKFWWQRQTRGYDDTEIWDLDRTIVEFLVPRLKTFRETVGSFPGHYITETNEDLAMELWQKDLDKIITGLEVKLNNSSFELFNNKHKLAAYEESKKLLIERLDDLWD